MCFSSTSPMVWAWSSLTNIISILRSQHTSQVSICSASNPKVLESQRYLSDKFPYHAVLPVGIHAMKKLSFNTCISCFHYSTYNYQLTTKSLLLAKHLDVSKDPYIVTYSEKQTTSILRLSWCLVWFQCI